MQWLQCASQISRCLVKVLVTDGRLYLYESLYAVTLGLNMLSKHLARSNIEARLILTIMYFSSSIMEELGLDICSVIHWSSRRVGQLN